MRLHPSSVAHRVLLAKTCIKCGVLRDARFYHRRKDGYFQAICFKCTSPSAQKATKRANHASWDTATKSGQRWTIAEINQLEELIKEGKPYKEIAQVVGRSITSITLAKRKYIKEN